MEELIYLDEINCLEFVLGPGSLVWPAVNSFFTGSEKLEEEW